jgi:hypothetical protein
MPDNNDTTNAGQSMGLATNPSESTPATLPEQVLPAPVIEKELSTQSAYTDINVKREVNIPEGVDPQGTGGLEESLKASSAPVATEPQRAHLRDVLIDKTPMIQDDSKFSKILPVAALLFLLTLVLVLYLLYKYLN